jgi:hypothetical protein
MNFKNQVVASNRGNESSEDDEHAQSDDYDDEIDKKDKTIIKLKSKLKKSKIKQEMKVHTTEGIDFDN